jgi:hypothetical protein
MEAWSWLAGLLAWRFVDLVSRIWGWDGGRWKGVDLRSHWLLHWTRLAAVRTVMV